MCQIKTLNLTDILFCLLIGTWKFLQKLYVTKAIQDTVNKKQLLIVLPFLVAQSFLIRKWLQSCTRNYLPYAFQSIIRLSSLFCFKDIIPKEISSHLVYIFMCSCCNRTYYRQSERDFVRAFEHISMGTFNWKASKKPPKVSYFQPHSAEGLWHQFWGLCNSLERKHII